MVTLDVVLSPISKFQCWFGGVGGGGLRLAGFFGRLTGFVNVQLLFTRAF